MSVKLKFHRGGPGQYLADHNGKTYELFRTVERDYGVTWIISCVDTGQNIEPASTKWAAILDLQEAIERGII